MKKLDEWYSKYYDPENIEFQKIVEKIENKFNSNKDLQILEVGCGTGRVTKQLFEKYSNVTAIDVNKNMLIFVKKNIHRVKMTLFVQIFQFLNLKLNLMLLFFLGLGCIIKKILMRF